MARPAMKTLFDMATRPSARKRGQRIDMIVDNFAGGGGASLGIEMATGRAVDLSINHSHSALTMHEFNHPSSKHLCDNVWRVDPVAACRGNPVTLAWFSPDCTHFSRAKGKKPVSQKIRCLAWVVIRWARKKKPRLIMLENVREFLDWAPLIQQTNEYGDPMYDDDGKKLLVPDPERKGESFKRWKKELERCGYVVDYRVLNAADYGTPTHRKRLFIIARCDGKRIKWPRPTHGPGRKLPWRTAAECIDWDLPCPSIFDPEERRRYKLKPTLAEKTLRRIALGVKRYVLDNPRPFIVHLTHGGDRRGHPVDEPLPTITCAKRGEMALIVPSLVQTGYGERDGQAPRTMSIEKPLGTVVAGGQKHGLVYAMLKHYGGVVGHSMDRPLGTVTAVDHHSLIAAHVTTLYGTNKAGHSADSPLGTVTAKGLKFGVVYAFLAKYFGTAIGQPANDPLHTITGKARFGVVTVKIDGTTYAIADIGMRMLQPRELARAQGFPEDYILTGSKSNQVAKVGNSVCPQVACALVKANWR